MGKKKGFFGMTGQFSGLMNQLQQAGNYSAQSISGIGGGLGEKSGDLAESEQEERVASSCSLISLEDKKY